MKKVLHKNKWNAVVVQLHVETPQTSLIKIKNGDNSDKDIVKIKLRMEPMSEKLDLNEFKMALFENGDL